jgi:mannosyltransferase OCH1-like enzyme
MVLYAYGGVYLDTDVECFTSVEPSLASLGLALNCESAPGERDAVGNAAVASAARSPFWLAVMREALRRAADPAFIAHENGGMDVAAWASMPARKRFLAKHRRQSLCVGGGASK